MSKSSDKQKEFERKVNIIESILEPITSKNVLVFNLTNKEAVVNFYEDTHKMYPFGTTLLELINNKDKIASIIHKAFENTDLCSEFSKNPLYYFLESTIFVMTDLYSSRNELTPFSVKVSPEELEEEYLKKYYENINNFIDIFFNNGNLKILNIPRSVKLRASDFIIPFSKNIHKNSYLDIFFYESIEDIFNIYTKLFIENKIRLNKCKNCGKYFIPLHKSNETLCNNIYKNGKTCKELSGEIKLSNDEILSIYRNAYKRENGKKNRYRHIPNIQLKFENWNKIAKEKYLDCQKRNNFKRRINRLAKFF